MNTLITSQLVKYLPITLIVSLASSLFVSLQLMQDRITRVNLAVNPPDTLITTRLTPNHKDFGSFCQPS